MKGCPKCGRTYEEAVSICPEDGEILVNIADAEADSLIGVILDGRYLIREKLGEGGMGTVYLAIHAVIEKRCAVKVLRHDVAGESGVAERFIQEARSAAAIESEHVIEINDFGTTPDGSPYFVMEYLNGRSLQELLQEQSVLETERAILIGIQCCEALAAAHASGVVHRDLKPENLFLVPRRGEQEFVKVLDFGIAKVARQTGRLTKTGAIFGTPQYMAPEQAAGTAIDERVDIYSLGIILYEMFCGKVPFEADTFMGVLTKHLYEAPIPPSEVREKGFPMPMESIILKALAKRPDRRYSSMTEMGDELKAVLRGEPPLAATEERLQSTLPPSPSEVVGASSRSSKRSVRRGWLAVSATAVMFGGAAVYYATAHDAPEPVPPVAATSAKTAAKVGPVKSPEIVLDSIPPGASLYLDGELLGVLPHEVRRPEEASSGRTYRVSLAGHRDLDVLVTAAMPEKMVVELKAQAIESVASTKETAEHKPKKRRRAKSKKRKKSESRLSDDIMDPWQ